jgi:hypothetical protein
MGDSKCFEYVINCVRCCLQCVERIVEFINKTAYIQMALRGKSFCEAAKDGFEIVWANPVRYLVVNGVGSIIMALGKVMIAATTTLVFYLAITYISSIQENVLEPIYLLIVLFVLVSWCSWWPLRWGCCLCLCIRWAWIRLCSALLLIRPISRIREARRHSMRRRRFRNSSIWTRSDTANYFIIH